ncbi:MAG: 4-alpha-glucanotransferase [Bacteroidetes bacterium]|nr:4-alpha-glucanotransferase [Bacteroidota bacterium]MCX7907832.1 4-alpha-glucanotransferase [Bacteroidota bacterium]MDW8138651.1 4-alpha-glucanotransferase [Bacteroidota bacterium]
MRFPRSSGILLHPTSLPGLYGSGDLGLSARRFVDWLSEAGQSLWQMLPIGPVGPGNSPYAALSAFAGNPLLIDLDDLVQRGWLEPDPEPPFRGLSPHRIDYPAVTAYRMRRLQEAAERFFWNASSREREAFEGFCERERAWLDDYALFMALHEHHRGSPWNSWDTPLALRQPDALAETRKLLAERVRFHAFTQWIFFQQWDALKRYANERGVRLFGDVPIFVAHHSADVWAHQRFFKLDKYGHPTVVAGVPPDYFSPTGQRWGNPLYRWETMAHEGYRWWIDRLRHALSLMDLIRIDHFRGFVACWEIPASEPTAERGRWVAGPAEALFDALEAALGRLPIVAEDLGVITDEVRALRERYGYPGMRVLQFAFSGGPENTFLPHWYEPNTVVYTGTHDNDTTRGWFERATTHERAFACQYANSDGREIHWDLIRLALASVADQAVFPLQDVLGLGSEARMNYPGTSEGNWTWRFSWDQISPEHTRRLYQLTALYGRCGPDRLF